MRVMHEYTTSVKKQIDLLTSESPCPYSPLSDTYRMIHGPFMNSRHVALFSPVW